MLSLRQLVRKNDDTFYVYNNGEKIDTKPRLILFLVVSCISALVLDAPIHDLLDGTITVHSILIGFSFTVMFFLVSRGEEHEADAARNDPSIERAIIRKKVSKLSRELFYNISYFSMVSIFCVILAVCLMMPNESKSVWNAIVILPINLRETIQCLYGIIAYLVALIARVCFLFLLTESIYTFYRAVRRVIYLFEEQIALKPQA